METIITNIILIVVIAAIVGLAVFYIIKAKKSGNKCIGCPDSAVCSQKKCEGGFGCSSCSNCNKAENK